MRLYVIGSCRVHGPLRNKSGYQRVIPGYTHTAKEAIQRLRFIRGEVQIPDRIAPYVFSRPKAPIVTDAHRRALQSSDVVIVEVCSAKDALYDGFWLNVNYANVHGLEYQSLEACDVKEDISLLSTMVNRLVVIHHVELPGIFQRSEFAIRLRTACQQLGIQVINPTDYLQDGDMLDANHYQPFAVTKIGDRIMERVQ